MKKSLELKLKDMRPEEIIAKVRNAGIVGAGGAGFPTHVKLSASADTVIINGAECEPLLRVDQQFLQYYSERVVIGLIAVMQATGAANGVIAIKHKHKTAIESMSYAIAGRPIRLHLLDDFYPAGDEHLTVFETTGRLVPQGGIPIKVGCVVVNVETLINVANALEGNPVTHSFLTIGGAVKNPTTLRLPIGTSVADALSLAGEPVLAGMTVIEGGPMMGKIVQNLSQPITKTTKGLLVFPDEHPLIQRRIMPIDKILKQAKTSCIQCRYCTDLCPRFLLGHKLEPHKIMRAVGHIQNQEEALKMALTCSECGICEQYACIMNLSPRIVNAAIKKELLKNGIRAEVPSEQHSSVLQGYRKVPVKRLINRLGIEKYNQDAAWNVGEVKVHCVKISLRQHAGVPSRPIVQVGQRVECNELIAVIPDNCLGANVHASISGIVDEVGDNIVITASNGGD